MTTNREALWSEYIQKHALHDAHTLTTIKALMHFWSFHAQIYSQNGEDGLLYYILQEINTTFGQPIKQPCVIELCCGDGYECNSAHLIRHHGYSGVLIDGKKENVEKARKCFQDFTSTTRVVRHWITKDHIVPLLTKYVDPSWQVDVLILDIDGNDYWILESILQSCQWCPRVIMVEYQDILGPRMAKTIPYQEQFYAWSCPWNLEGCQDGPNFAGASLMAFFQLLKSFNYKFVGCEAQGFNGFFVHQDCIPPGMYCFQEDELSTIFEFIPKVKNGQKTRFPLVEHAPWVDVPFDKTVVDRVPS